MKKKTRIYYVEWVEHLYNIFKEAAPNEYALKTVPKTKCISI